MFTAFPNEATLIAVIPTSWYGAITASNSPRIARTLTAVGAGDRDIRQPCSAARWSITTAGPLQFSAWAALITTWARKQSSAKASGRRPAAIINGGSEAAVTT